MIPFILAGRCAERGQAPRRCCATCPAGARAKDVVVLRDGVETRSPPHAPLAVSDRFVVSPGKIATDSTVSRADRPSTRPCSPASRCRSSGESATPWWGDRQHRWAARHYARRESLHLPARQMAKLVEDAQNGRPRSSGSPTGSPACSCRSSSSSRR
ncbi:hypothetical protein HBB16_06690 [Pseudonocardia sp. MCCB 268]|nr:hypothetical protein [Pseudonocardia cytotoxica]